MSNVKKDPKKAVMLSLFPGLGFLYLENFKYFLCFFFLVIAPMACAGTMGSSAFLVSLAMYGLSIYYCNTKAIETLKNPVTLRKDPYYILCLSFVMDGWGQLALKQRGKAIVMFSSGFSMCLLSWVSVIMMFPSADILTKYDGAAFNIINLMVVWTIASIPIKILGLIDAFYSTYHLYVAKRE